MMRAALCLAALGVTGCGITFGVDAVEKTTIAGHPGVGFQMLLINDTTPWKALTIEGQERTDFVGTMTTVEWQSSGADEAPARTFLDFVPQGTRLQLVPSGGAENVTRGDIAVKGPSRLDVQVNSLSDEVSLYDLRGEILVDAASLVFARGLNGSLVSESRGSADIESAGVVDISTDEMARVTLSGSGIISAGGAVELEVPRQPSGPIDATSNGEEPGLVRLTIPEGVGATIVIDTGRFAVGVGLTDIAVAENDRIQSIALAGGGPEIYLASDAGVIVTDGRPLELPGPPEDDDDFDDDDDDDDDDF